MSYKLGHGVKQDYGEAYQAFLACVAVPEDEQVVDHMPDSSLNKLVEFHSRWNVVSRKRDPSTRKT